MKRRVIQDEVPHCGVGSSALSIDLNEERFCSYVWIHKLCAIFIDNEDNANSNSIDGFSFVADQMQWLKNKQK